MAVSKALGARISDIDQSVKPLVAQERDEMRKSIALDAKPGGKPATPAAKGPVSRAAGAAPAARPAAKSAASSSAASAKAGSKFSDADLGADAASEAGGAPWPASVAELQESADSMFQDQRQRRGNLRRSLHYE